MGESRRNNIGSPEKTLSSSLGRRQEKDIISQGKS